MDRSSRSRRSYPNLHNLSLAPLKTSSIDASMPPSPSEGQVQTPHTSYMAHKSAPATPGILSLSQSRSSSRSGRRRSKGYAYESYFLNPDAPHRDVGDIPKAKSTSHMLPGVSFADEPRARHHQRKGTAPALRVSAVRHHTSEPDEEWWHRAGLAIAGEARDSKGQGWLVRRESSTSLAPEHEERSPHDPRHMALLSGEHFADVEHHSPFTPRMSRAGSRLHSAMNSRVGSRVPSARNSRRGSRVGSKVDLMMSGAVKPPSARQSLELDESMFEEGMVEPDFVDDEESDGDEEEIARLAAERGFGLGSWIDRFIGWSLFSVDEEGDDSDEDEEEDDDDAVRPENMTKEELKLRREVEAKRRKLEREAIIAAAAVKNQGSEVQAADGSGATEADRPPNEDGGGWQDAAWLLGVASKVIY